MHDIKSEAADVEAWDLEERADEIQSVVARSVEEGQDSGQGDISQRMYVDQYPILHKPGPLRQLQLRQRLPQAQPRR